MPTGDEYHRCPREGGEERRSCCPSRSADRRLWYGDQLASSSGARNAMRCLNKMIRSSDSGDVVCGDENASEEEAKQGKNALLRTFVPVAVRGLVVHSGSSHVRVLSVRRRLCFLNDSLAWPREDGDGK